MQVTYIRAAESPGIMPVACPGTLVKCEPAREHNAEKLEAVHAVVPVINLIVMVVWGNTSIPSRSACRSTTTWWDHSPQSQP